jgi:FkbM family methyltransferase
MPASQPQGEPPAFGTFAPTGLVAWALQRTRALGDGWLPRRLAYALRRIGVRALAGKPVDTETLGARMRVYPQVNICEKRILFTPQYFDPVEREVLAASIRPGYRFIDIGANVGAYALFVAALAGREARILAIEPQPDVFAKLAYNISLNPFGTVKAIACAVADKPGELSLFLDPRNQGESSVRVVQSPSANAIKVPAVTLLHLVESEGFSHIDAIKIDVEGAEDLILEPFFAQAPEALWPRLIILEDSTSRWSVDLLPMLSRHGYQMVARTRLNFVLSRDV